MRGEIGATDISGKREVNNRNVAFTGSVARSAKYLPVRVNAGGDGRVPTFFPGF